MDGFDVHPLNRSNMTPVINNIFTKFDVIIYCCNDILAAIYFYLFFSVEMLYVDYYRNEKKKLNQS